MSSPVREIKDWFRHSHFPRRSHSYRSVASRDSETTGGQSPPASRQQGQPQAQRDCPFDYNEDEGHPLSLLESLTPSVTRPGTSVTVPTTPSRPRAEHSTSSSHLQQHLRSSPVSFTDTNEPEGDQYISSASPASGPARSQANTSSQPVPTQFVEPPVLQQQIHILDDIATSSTELNDRTESPPEAVQPFGTSSQTTSADQVALAIHQADATTHFEAPFTLQASRSSSDGGARVLATTIPAAAPPTALSQGQEPRADIHRVERTSNKTPLSSFTMSSNQSGVMADEQQAKAVKQIANISRLLRDAINAALPVAPEQYLSVAVPGTVIDTRNIRDGGTFVWKATDSSFPPSQVMQAEAKLVDNMVPLSYVMLGNTGKSVARSYDRALDCLVARKANVLTGDDGEAKRSPGNDLYDASMAFLRRIDPITGKTCVDAYIEKQKAWAHAQTEWNAAKINAKEAAVKAFPPDIEKPKDMSYVVKQQQHYNDWNQANYRKYKFAVQGRYIDWVANGYKYDVESNFGTVDIDSIIARLESSKESLRNSTVVDADGANEVHLVSLTPKNWAELCEWKERDWFRKNDNYSLAQLDAEIERLQQLQLSYVTMGTAMGMTIDDNFNITAVDPQNAKYPAPGMPAPDMNAAKTGLKDAFSNIYDAQGELAKAINTAKQANPTMKADEIMKVPEVVQKTDDLNQKRKALAGAVEKHQDTNAEWTKWSSANMSDAKSQEAMKSWLKSTLLKLKSNIDKLEAKRDAKQKKSFDAPPVIATADAAQNAEGALDGKTTTVANGSEDPKPIFGISDGGSSHNAATGGAGGDDNKTEVDVNGLPQPGTVSDPWTTITASFSAKDQSSLATTSSWGMSVGGGAGWGLWSAGGSYSHEQSNSDYQGDMSSCDVSVSFSALVVNINRPWLYGELFADEELDTADGFHLSPGPRGLKDMMSKQVKRDGNSDALSDNKEVIDELAKYNMFPAYPTSFVVAADTTVEFHGDTQHIEKHFSSQSNSGSVSVGWGPFSVSSSFHQSSSRESFQMQSTATGCRLNFGAPQIIGWVNQILPALPRLKGYEPMVQYTGSLKG